MDRTLISILAGLGGMFGWGTSDFLANISSESIGHVRALFWSQLAGLGLVVVTLLFLGTTFSASLPFFILIILSGIAYALGYLYFYHAFEVGHVAVVSSLINLQTIFVMAFSFIFYGQRLMGWQIPGVVFIVLGVFLVSVDFGALMSGKVSFVKGVKETLIAAVMFGILFWPSNEYIVERTDWLAVMGVTKVVTLVVIWLLSLKQKSQLALPKITTKQKVALVAVGILEAFGVLSVSFGISIGDAIIVQPIAAALTIVTIGMAAIFLKEKITTPQKIGIMGVITGIIMSGLA
jgi:uncharacterized membrane protein